MEILIWLIGGIVAVLITIMIVVVGAFVDKKSLDKKLTHWEINPHWSFKDVNVGQRIAEHVSTLAAQERSTQMRNNYMDALHYCESILDANGFTVTKEKFTHQGVYYREVVPLWKFRLFPYRRGKLEGVNLSATLNPSPGIKNGEHNENGEKNENITTSNSTPLLLVAHLDTVVGSPGADDNAAGVGVLLSFAETVNAEKLTRPVTVLLTDHEEVGLIGAKHWVKNHTEWLKENSPEIVILESVGYYSGEDNSQTFPLSTRLFTPKQQKWLTHNKGRGDFLAIGQRKHSSKLGDVVMNLLDTYNIKTLVFNDPRDARKWWTKIYNLIPSVGKYNRSDHKPFWDEACNAIVLNDTVRWRGSPYHQKVDIPEFVDYKNLHNITQTLIALAYTDGDITLDTK